MNDSNIVGFAAIGFLTLAFAAVWRGKTWRGVLTGSEPLRFEDLADLFRDDEEVTVCEAPNAADYPDLEVAKQILSSTASVLYYSSQQPSGKIETMDILMYGKRGRVLKYRAEVCVGYAAVGRPMLPLPREANRIADAFGDRVRKLALTHSQEPS